MDRKSVNLTLEYFDLNKLCDDNGVWMSPMGIIYGFRRTGKSNKIVSLLYETRHRYGSAHRFSPTADNPTTDGSTIYGNIFPKACCWSFPTFQLLEKIEHFQNYLCMCNPVGCVPQDKFCLVLLDDLSSRRKIINSEKLVIFASNCRNNQITLLLAIQYFNHVKPEIRCNCDFFMTNSERSGVTVSKMFKEVFSMFPDELSFKKCLKMFTKNYGSVVWFNSGGSKCGIEDCVFIYDCIEIDDVDKNGNYFKRRVNGGDFTIECGMTEELTELGYTKTLEQIMEEKKIQTKLLLSQSESSEELTFKNKPKNKKYAELDFNLEQDDELDIEAQQQERDWEIASDGDSDEDLVPNVEFKKAKFKSKKKEINNFRKKKKSK